MITIMLDIETKPRDELVPMCERAIKPKGNLKDPAKIEADLQEKREALQKTMSVSPDLAKIAFIGVKVLDKEPEFMSMRSFAEYIGAIKTAYRFVTFNGKKFDIPLLIKEGAREGIDLPYMELSHMLKRYNTDTHIDLMEVLACGDNSYNSKDFYARAYLGIEPEPIDFSTCSDEELMEHCKEDLIVTEGLYKMFEGRLF